jgi:hypothetical protein
MNQFGFDWPEAIICQEWNKIRLMVVKKTASQIET